MKFKTFIAAGAVACATATAFADAAGGSVFGILKLDDPYTTNLYISVPWVDCTDSSQNVLVSNVVKTTNLAEGDYLIAKIGDDYYGWNLVGTPPDLHWDATTSIDDSGVESFSSPDDTRVARGMALMLHRENPSASNPIYLFGQYTDSDATTSIGKGVTALIGNPGTNDLAITALAAKFTVGAPVSGDKIIVTQSTASKSGTKTYTYNGANWTYKTAGETVGAGYDLPGSGLNGSHQTGQTGAENIVGDSVKIKAGNGFWYQRSNASGVGSATIKW